MSPKKILFVIESLHCGGAEKSLVTLLQNMDFRKYQVELLMLVSGGNFEKFVPKEVIVKTIDPIRFNKIQKLFKRTYFFLLRSLYGEKYHTAQLYWKIYGKNFKVIDSDYDFAVGYNQGFASYFVAEKTYAKRKFSWLNTDYIKAGYNIGFDYYFYNQMNAVVCVSEANESSFQKALKTVDKNLETKVIKDITDPTVIKKMAKEDIDVSFDNQKTTICTVGRLAKAKNIDLAIETCKFLLGQGRDIEWYVVGEGDEREKLEALVQNYGIQDHFYLLGYDENPYKFIDKCDIYVQSSLFEGLGLSVIEAMILEKPVVITNFVTANTLVIPEETGLISEMNPEALAAQISKYLDHTELKNAVINNLSKIENKDKDISLRKIKNLFDEPSNL